MLEQKQWYRVIAGRCPREAQLIAHLIIQGLGVDLAMSTNHVPTRGDAHHLAPFSRDSGALLRLHLGVQLLTSCRDTGWEGRLATLTAKRRSSLFIIVCRIGT